MTDRIVAPNYEHSGPPPYVPLSGGAVTALVLTFVAFFIGLVGPWWCEVVPLLIVAMCWGGISRGVRRGRVVAIIALVLALLGAAFCYFSQKAIATAIADSFAPVVTAIEKGDRAKLEKWAGASADRDARIERWSARAKAAWASAGAFSGGLQADFMKFGWLYGLAARPDFREEFEPKGDKPPAQATIWFRAPCANGDVYVAFDYGTLERFNAVITKLKTEHPARDPKADPQEAFDTMFAGNVEEIRFFR